MLEARIDQFDAEMRSLIENYVEQQDFHALETSLKSEKQIKEDLKDKLLKENNFKGIARGTFNAIHLINAYLLTLNDEKKAEKVMHELYNAFKIIGEYKNNVDSINTKAIDSWDLNVSIWTAVYGLSNETLSLIYDIVLKCFNNNEIENSKRSSPDFIDVCSHYTILLECLRILSSSRRASGAGSQKLFNSRRNR